MKKQFVVISVLALSIAGAHSALAKPVKFDEPKTNAGYQTAKKTGLENALDHVKNPKAREAIKRAMERQKEQKPEAKTDEQIVALDKAALKIGYSGTDSAAGVTQALNLPTKGKYGSTITWTSSNPAVISNDGKTVVRPTGADAKVVLTATLKMNAATATVQFEVVVKAQLTDAAKVAADKAALAIGFSAGDSASSVTSKLTLPTTGANGSTIVWVSSAPAVISNDGKTVNRPSAAQGDVSITLTAYITSGTVTDVKSFTVVVKKQLTDAEEVAADKAALEIGYSTGDSASSVTSKLTLPTAGANGSTIVWVSSAPTVISNDGKTVNRPSATQGDTTVTLTAFITNGTVTDSKSFTVVVKRQLTDAEKVAADKAALEIGYSTGDSASSVTSKLTLPTTGANGSAIVWVSSAPTVVSNDGKTVNRPASNQSDATVTLTAYITSGTATDTKAFSIVVKRQLTDAEKVAADKAALEIGFSTGDSASSVTSKLTLPTTGVNGSTIVWYSGNTAVITNEGLVVRPAGADMQVTLNAIIVGQTAVETKAFTVTVKKLP
ncbi:immunoglobulin-like domain-containing protein [Paenibacillus thermotolerans]|uniref:immunoglobulin-like domain-containing protein n=1 Tax=Paenibacillus thermotolerans TaxID=3027807 RepID=UPI0023679A5A|nr:MULTISPECIES: immunoglobulin-like domain-containing protein [unclassified Paenibacillus]